MQIHPAAAEQTQLPDLWNHEECEKSQEKKEAF